jgi:hypothetical protein
MSFIAGSASFVRFSIEGELPDNPLDFIAERIRAYSFADIDDNFEEYSIGWVSVLNMFDAAFAYASYFNGDYVVLSLRVDERKVSPAILRKYTLKESTLYFFSTNKKAHVLLEDFFKDCFGMLLLQQIPYVTAEHLLVEKQRLAQLEHIAPEIFV